MYTCESKSGTYGKLGVVATVLINTGYGWYFGCCQTVDFVTKCGKTKRVEVFFSHRQCLMCYLKFVSTAVIRLNPVEILAIHICILLNVLEQDLVVHMESYFARTVKSVIYGRCFGWPPAFLKSMKCKFSSSSFIQQL